MSGEGVPGIRIDPTIPSVATPTDLRTLVLTTRASLLELELELLGLHQERDCRDRTGRVCKPCRKTTHRQERDAPLESSSIATWKSDYGCMIWRLWVEAETG